MPRIDYLAPLRALDCFFDGFQTLLVVLLLSLGGVGGNHDLLVRAPGLIRVAAAATRCDRRDEASEDRGQNETCAAKNPMKEHLRE